MTKSRSEHGEFRFRVKEFGDGTTYLAAEPERSAMPALALTFDDGPNDVHTPQLLDMLTPSGVKATFFVIGRLVKQHPAIVRRILAEGHAIGNHTLTHTKPLVNLQGQQVWKELSD